MTNTANTQQVPNRYGELTAAEQAIIDRLINRCASMPHRPTGTTRISITDHGQLMAVTVAP